MPGIECMVIVHSGHQACKNVIQVCVDLYKGEGEPQHMTALQL